MDFAKTSINTKNSNFASVGNILTEYFDPLQKLTSVFRLLSVFVCMFQLEVGETYEIVVTNWHGLYRNRFGDVVKVVGYTNNTPKYIFQYR